MKTAVLLLATLALSGSAVAGPVDSLNITAEEHAACDSDAISLCAFTYPDEAQLLVCMKANRQKLSSMCQTAFVSGMKRRRIPL